MNDRNITIALTAAEALDMRQALNRASIYWGDKARANADERAACLAVAEDHNKLWKLIADAMADAERRDCAEYEARKAKLASEAIAKVASVLTARDFHVTRVASSAEGRELRVTWHTRRYGRAPASYAIRADGTFRDVADEAVFAAAVNAGEFDTIADATAQD